MDNGKLARTIVSKRRKANDIHRAIANALRHQMPDKKGSTAIHLFPKLLNTMSLRSMTLGASVEERKGVGRTRREKRIGSGHARQGQPDLRNKVGGSSSNAGSRRGEQVAKWRLSSTAPLREDTRLYIPDFETNISSTSLAYA